MGDESGEANHVFANAKPLEQEQNVEVRFVEHKKKNDEKEGQQQKDIFIDLTMGGKETRTKSFGARVDKVSLFSFVSFAWMFGWMWRAYKGRVNTDPGLSAQWTCSIFDSANVNVKRLEHLWNEEKGAAARSAPDSAPLRRPPSLVRAVLRFLAHRLALAALVFLFCIVFGFIGPTCLVRGLVAFAERPPLQNGEEGKWTDGGQQRIDRSQGLWLALTLLVVEIFRVLAYGATWAIGYRTAIRTRSAVLGLLYETLLSAKTIRGKTPAEIVNIFANDGQRIFDAVTFAPLVLVGPFVLIGGLFYLLRVIGPLSLLAIAVFFAFDFIQGVLGVVLVKCRNLAVAQTEKRMARIGELIHCIKTIKLNCWEELFFRRVCEVREREQHYLQIAGYTQSLMIAAGAIVPSVATIVMVLAIVLNGHDLRESDAFSAITVFFVMLFGVRMIPYGIRYFVEARQSLLKIGQLLTSFEEYNESEYATPSKCPNAAIQMKGCTFAWDTIDERMVAGTGDKADNNKRGQKAQTEKNGKLPLETTEAETTALTLAENENEEKNNGPIGGFLNEKQRDPICLRDIDLNIQKGELVGVCGVIGSGKSALLNAISGHMVGQRGDCSISGSIALCPQRPSILQGTVRENILFGQPMDSGRYSKVMEAVQLATDLERMPQNDCSKVSASKLSGGQRARISIARALYSNRDIFLFDDIFSSVDKPVARRIFNEGIVKLLEKKTRMLVTSDPEYLRACNSVLLVDRGHIVRCGPASLVMDSSQYKTIFATNATAPEEQESGQKMAEEGKTKEEEEEEKGEERRRRRRTEQTEGGEEEEGDEEREEDLGLKPVDGQVYREYILAGGGFLMLALVVAAFVLNVGSNIFATVWLSKWMREVHGDHPITPTAESTFSERQQNIMNSSSQSADNALSPRHQSLADPDTGLAFYTHIYLATLVVLFLSGLFKAIAFVKLSLSASTQLHNRMLRRVLFATAKFFQQTPAGRILNRFSKDMDEIDVKLPFSTEAFLQGIVTCLGFLLVIIWVFPLFLLPSIPLFLLFLFFLVCFRAGIRSLKRVENVTRSPLFEHVSSSLEAIPTIHSFGQTGEFVKLLKARLDENSGALFLYHAGMRWQAVWLDLLVVGITFLVSMFIVLLTGSIPPAEAGMAIAFALQMSGIFQFAIRSQTELEAKMTAVERVNHYSKYIEIEPDTRDPTDLPINWPQKGNLEFRDVSLRYPGRDQPALSNVNFVVASGDKVGIVGRTGSGKTSLCNALFRLYPLEKGQILMDGRDISTLNLRTLRRAIAIIPQEPTLFADTLRFNIDPEGHCKGDDKIWDCLGRIGLSESLNNFAERLDFLVDPDGANLSAGQRQLVCMVRTLLRKTRIVVLDEATANIDEQTDGQLQKAVADCFADRTVLLVAHRVKNVTGKGWRLLEMKNGGLLTQTLEKTNADDEPPKQQKLYPALSVITVDDDEDDDDVVEVQP